MKSFSTLSSSFTDQSGNSSSTNATRGKQWINDEHRYLLQKYFDNVFSVTLATVGGGSYTLTGSLSAGGVTATLTASWTLTTGYQLVNFSSGEQRNVLFTNGSTGISWAQQLTQSATTAISTTGQQYYNLPANVSKIKDLTITVGQLKFTPGQILTQADWDSVNFLPYTSDIPQYVFVTVDPTGAPVIGVFPIPSTTGNVITFNTKRRIADMTYADYSTGTIAGTAGSTAITGTATSWNTTGFFPLTTDLTFLNLFIQVTPPKGDGIWYQIRRFTDDTHLVLVNPLINTPLNPLTGATYTIGQFPLLQEDFHDMILYRPLELYFGSVKVDEKQYSMYQGLRKDKMALLDDYAGTREVNVDLGSAPNPINPNLFIYANS